MTATAFVKPSRLRAVVRRHPWIYGDSVDRVEGEYENGDAVVVRAPDGKFVAHAWINDASRLFLRLVSFDKGTAADEELLRRRVRDAVALRHDLLGLPRRAEAYRVVHSEGDGIPGLIVDRYGDVLVLTCTSLGTHRRLEAVVDELGRLFPGSAILEQGVSAGLRAKEGLPEGRGVLRGDAPAEDPRVRIDGLDLGVPLTSGQKTALFLDQRENARLLAGLAEGKRVLDACSYVGTFGIAAARAGAAECLLFDSSGEAVAHARRNAEVNGVADRVEVREGELFAELRALADTRRTFDAVVLDPPKFARSARERERGRKGYLDANLLALRLVPPGGLLFTFSCSHHVSEEELEKVLREASSRSGADLRVLERRGAGPDHPTDVHCPQGRYLKGLLIQRRG